MSVGRPHTILPHVSVDNLEIIDAIKLSNSEGAGGLPLDSFLGTPGFGERVRASAALIAWLHDSRVGSFKRYPLEACLADLDRWSEELVIRRPESSDQFLQQLASLRRQAAHLPSTRLAPSHGNFTYRQVQFEGIQAILIKVDELTLADPAIDVANFAVHLRLLAMQNLPDPYGLDAIADRFVQEYLLYRPSPGFMQRLAFYEIAMIFRLMNAVLERQQLAHHFEALLETEKHLVHPSG